MIVNDVIEIEPGELSRRQEQKLKHRLSFVRESDGAFVTTYIQHRDGTLRFPRGGWSLLPDSVEYTDERTFPRLPQLQNVIELDAHLPDGRVYEGQREALAAIFEHEQGLIIRPPGTGKTQIALKFIADVGTRTIVFVHTEDILQQWKGYAEAVIPELQGLIGIQQGKTLTIGHLTLAMVQTINECNYGEEWWEQFGAVIFDEAHHIAAPTWELVANQSCARYRIGFTATETRADTMHPLMPILLGPIIYKLKFESAIPVSVVRVNTRFNYKMRHSRRDWPKLITALTEDVKRNRKIARIADSEIQAGHSVLVLSRRIDHLANIREEMVEGDDAEILAAKLVTKKKRKEVLGKFRAGEVKCVLATQLADEALDIPILSRVILTFPSKHSGKLLQQVGRALRQHAEKEEAIIYEIVDHRQPVLRNQWRQRRKWYRKVGMKIRRAK